jgi:protein-tyrosine phosphatase
MKILFVCLGNICRSPLAEGILRKKLEQEGLDGTIEVDSAGFEPFHTGDNPDPRSIAVAKKNGIDISKLTARLFRPEDFDTFDKIYVMDHNNYRDVILRARVKADQDKVDFVMNLAEPGLNKKVPDPWYGKQHDFEVTYTMLNKALDVLLRNIKSELK